MFRNSKTNPYHRANFLILDPAKFRCCCGEQQAPERTIGHDEAPASAAQGAVIGMKAESQAPKQRYPSTLRSISASSLRL
jgi:hypothetical protein